MLFWALFLFFSLLKKKQKKLNTNYSIVIYYCLIWRVPIGVWLFLTFITCIMCLKVHHNKSFGSQIELVSQLLKTTAHSTKPQKV